MRPEARGTDSTRYARISRSASSRVRKRQRHLVSRVESSAAHSPTVFGNRRRAGPSLPVIPGSKSMTRSCTHFDRHDSFRTQGRFDSTRCAFLVRCLCFMTRDAVLYMQSGSRDDEPSMLSHSRKRSYAVPLSSVCPFFLQSLV